MTENNIVDGSAASQSRSSFLPKLSPEAHETGQRCCWRIRQE
jgi:hypothetical protein